MPRPSDALQSTGNCCPGTEPGCGLSTGLSKRPRPVRLGALSLTSWFSPCQAGSVMLKLALCTGMAMGVPLSYAQIGPVSRYAVMPNFQPMELASGPDGKLWFSGRTLASPGDTRLVRMGLDGSLLNAYVLNPTVALPTRLAAGPDGKLWVNTWGNTITQVDPGTGGQTPIAMPSSLGSYGASGITSGADGNLWMVMPRGLARITPQGQVTAFPVDTSGSYYGLSSGIINGPDGQLWFGNLSDPWRLYRLAPSNGAQSSVDISNLSFGAQTLAPGPDGQVWFLPSGYPAIAKIDPASQQITSYPIRTYSPNGLAAGPDQNLWYVTSAYSTTNVIGRITPQGAVTEYPLPTGIQASGLMVGPDGNFWYIESQQDPITQDDLYDIATFALPTAVPSCSAAPAQGFSNTVVTFSCSGLADGGQLSVQGGSCGTPRNGSAQCSAPLGSTDGTVVFTDGQGRLSYMPHTLTQLSQAYCFASPDQAFAGTSINLSCYGLPNGATLTIPGALCQAPHNDGSVGCQGVLGSGPNALGAMPQAPTRLADGTLGTSDIWLRTLVVHCSAYPNPAQIGQQVNIVCPDAPDGSTVQIAGAQCGLPDGNGASCSGVAGTGPSDLQANPEASISFYGVVGTSAVPLDIQAAQSPGPGSGGDAGSAVSIPALDELDLSLTALLLGAMGSLGAQPRRKRKAH